MATPKRFSWLYLLGYTLFFALLWYSMRNLAAGPAPKQVPYSEFLAEVRAGHVDKVRIDQTMLTATLKKEAVKQNEPGEIAAERLPGIDETSLLQDLEAQHVTFSGHVEQAGWWLSVQLQDQIAVMLGGRAAEELVYKGVISTGASDDLQRASELVRQMATRFGMSDRLGHLTYGTQQNARFLRPIFTVPERNYSEKTAEEIDAEVRRIADELYARAKDILTKRRSELERIAQELIQKESLDRRQLELLLDSPLKQKHKRGVLSSEF